MDATSGSAQPKIPVGSLGVDGAKIPVGILGATGMVGQKFVELLHHHPWFQITAVAASDRSCGKPYKEAATWRMSTPLPAEVGNLTVSSCDSDLPCKIVFSALDASVAGEIETKFAKAGYFVISNSRNHRLDPDVPLLIPEVNPSHLELIKTQSHAPGMILTNPNCSVIGLATALKPLDDFWSVEQVHVTTLQAVSGAGYPGVPSFDTLDNVIPYIAGEEEKIETEPLKILGTLRGRTIMRHPMRLSAQCNRVSVADGHLACVSVKLKKRAAFDEMVEAWNQFTAAPQKLQLPSAPRQPIIYHPEDNYPQPKLHRHLEKGMAVSVGRLRPCPLLDWKFTILSHNTIRGAAGCAVLNAELLYSTFLKKTM